MRRKELLNFATATVVLLAGLHFLASRYDLYFHLWWFDILMHFLGGLFISLYSLWFFFFSGRITINFPNNKKIFLLSLLAVFPAIVFWEIFEYVTDTAYPFEGYVLDTAADIALGLTGALAGVLYFIKKEKKFLWTKEAN